MIVFRKKHPVRKIVVILVLAVSASIGISLYFLYSISIEQLGIRLHDFAHTEAHFIENIAALNEQNDPTGNKALIFRKTFEILDNIQYETGGFGETGEFTVARREGNMIVYYLSRHQTVAILPAPIEIGSYLAEPMQKVLLERKGGVMIGRDYRGVMVLSAFEPVQFEEFAVVAKIDLSEVRQPYIYAALTGIILSFIFIVIGAGLIVRIGNSIIRKLEKTNTLLSSEIQSRTAAEEEVRYANEELEAANEEMATTLEEIDRSQNELLRSYGELHESKLKFQLSFENANVGMCLVDLAGKFIHVNRMMSSMLGYTVEELETKTVVNITYHDDVNASLRYIEKAISSDPDRSTIEKRYVHKDGHIVWGLVTCSLVRDSDGSPAYLIAQIMNITDHKQAIDDLIQSQTHLDLALQSANMGVWRFEVRENRRYFDSRTCSILDLDPETFHGSTEEFFRVIHPDDRENVRAAIETSLATDAPYISEFRVIWSDGSLHYCSARGVLTYGDDGKPLRINGVVLDISEHKLDEEKIRSSLKEKETLLQELYHRTKNNMQVIASFLQLQAANVKDERFDNIVGDIVTRIHAMSLVHQKLYRSQNLSRIDLKEYIVDLVINILSYLKVSQDKVSVRFDIEAIEALIDIAMPCGLVINELVSNALKYAFPVDRKGELTIALHRNPSGDIVLKISDNGVGVDAGVDMRNLKSLGVQTVFNIVERQLGGSVNYDLSDGLKWTITFKDTLYKERV